MDAFPLTTLRYALASAILLGILALVEGRRALDGRGLRLFGLGTLGFAGFNLLAFTGLDHAEPQSAALVVAHRSSRPSCSGCGTACATPA